MLLMRRVTDADEDDGHAGGARWSWQSDCRPDFRGRPTLSSQQTGVSSSRTNQAVNHVWPQEGQLFQRWWSFQYGGSMAHPQVRGETLSRWRFAA